MSQDIQKSKILVVEGFDESIIVGSILRQMEIDDVEIRNAQGKDRVNKALGALALSPGFEKVTSVGVLVDADTDARGAFKSVLHGLRQSGLPIPNGTGEVANNGVLNASVFVLPGDDMEGMLETIVWASVVDQPLAFEAAQYLERCWAIVAADNEADGDGPVRWKRTRNLHKAKVHALLAAISDDPRLGISTQRRLFDLGHESFAQLRAFLGRL